jgi:GTP-binding protein
LTQPTYNSTSTLATAGIPTLAIVGRPNVGKSTLFNRIVGSRRAIVGDEPGITRDRLYGDAEWRGRDLRIVDTGGILPEDKDFIPSEIYRQARVAFDEASAIIMVVDGRTELAGPDLELARLLRKANKPLFLAVNKVDSDKQSSLIDDFHRLGIPKMTAISAEHGRGIDDLLDAIFEVLPPDEGSAGVPPSVRSASRPPTAELGIESTATDLAINDPANTDEQPASDDGSHETKVAIIGHPNVGKSTLLNCLTASDRAIVSPVPGTTRDAVDEVVEHNGRRFRFIDTAGIRRKGKTHLMAEKLSVVMARKHLEGADIALLVIDATEGVSQLDASIAGLAHESGRSVIIVVNKWDLVLHPENRAGKQTARPTKAERMRESKRPGDRDAYEQRLRDELKFLNYAPIVFISAKSGKGTEKIFPLLEEVATERRKRVTTGQMNRFIEKVDFERASDPMRQRVKILYMTQASVAPPTFVLFTNRAVKLHFSYQRFLENQIRKAFGFVGTPIWIKNRARDS